MSCCEPSWTHFSCVVSHSASPARGEMDCSIFSIHIAALCTFLHDWRAAGWHDYCNFQLCPFSKRLRVYCLMSLLGQFNLIGNITSINSFRPQQRKQKNGSLENNSCRQAEKAIILKRWCHFEKEKLAHPTWNQNFLLRLIFSYAKPIIDEEIFPKPTKKPVSV